LTFNTFFGTAYTAEELELCFNNAEIGLFADAITIAATKKLYFDGGENTYLVESSADVIDIFNGGTMAMRIQSANVAIGDGRNFIVQPTGRLYLDGGGDSFMYEGTVNSWQIYLAASLKFAMNENGTMLADTSFVVFSPNIKENKEYADLATITAEHYLQWSLEDAKKPCKKYSGIPHLKKEIDTTTTDCVFETAESMTTEKAKYSKDIAKMAMGTTRWAEWANEKIKELETKIVALEKK
jgi:hypothetical protein